jgi:hypothetical protein
MDLRPGRLARCAIAALAVVTSALVLVGADGGREASAQEEPAPLPPLRKGRLLAWLKTFEYRDTYTPEPAVHASTGPHGGNVRTWYSPSLVADLEAGKRRLRRGAVMVKELYGSGQTVLQGWAVMIKTREARAKSPRAWVWYETFRLDGRGAIAGRGVSLCASCHRKGPDFLRSTFRP